MNGGRAENDGEVGVTYFKFSRQFPAVNDEICETLILGRDLKRSRFLIIFGLSS
jgi:hypothetical protein